LVFKNELVNVLITARGGSKRLPNKNLKNLCGKPLIAWTIEAAKNSDYVNQVFVSTDSLEIEKISKDFGACVPRLRDKSLADDNATSFDTAVDFLEYFTDDENGEMLLLQPTSPLRNSDHINELMRKVRLKNANQCVAVRDVTKFFCLTPQKLSDNKKIYIPNGSMYYTKTNFLKKVKTFFAQGSEFFLMDDYFSIDIDTKTDWDIAEACIQKLLCDEKNKIT